jgi:hypothetical protein
MMNLVGMPKTFLPGLIQLVALQINMHGSLAPAFIFAGIHVLVLRSFGVAELRKLKVRDSTDS